ELSDPRSVSEAERIRQNDESVSVPVLCHVESAVQVSGALHVHGSNVHRQRTGYPIQLSKLRCIDVGVRKDGDAGRPGYDLLEELQVLAAQLGKIEKHPSNVACRPCDTRHQPGLNRIDFEVYPCNRDRTSRILSGCQSPGASGENHINVEACEFKCEFGEKFRLVVRGS